MEEVWGKRRFKQQLVSHLDEPTSHLDEPKQTHCLNQCECTGGGGVEAEGKSLDGG